MSNPNPTPRKQPKKCPEGHSYEEYGSRPPGSHKIRCKECQRQYARRKREEIADYISSLKDVPCADCGGRFPPEAMDFDHVRGEKKFNIATITRTYMTRKRIDEEIAKCEVVCSNCHRVRTKAGGRTLWGRGPDD